MAFFEARGFFGDYEVALQLPNGLNTTQTFTLSPGSNPVVIELHLPGICFMILCIPRLGDLSLAQLLGVFYFP